MKSRGVAILAAQMMLISLLLGIFWASPDVRFDSPTYLVVKQASLLDPATWNGYRTMGYPLFLKLVTMLDAEGGVLPLVQFLLFGGAVLLFFRGLRAISVPEAPAVLAASAVLWAEPVLEGRYTHVLTDFVGLALAVASVGALLLFVARDSWRERMLVGGLVAATYHVRPAYLFLVPLLPLLAWILGRVTNVRGRWPLLGALVLVPFLAYCAARYAAFGQFNLVSFGGLNAIGIAGQLLDERHLPELSEETAPLAKAIIERRGSVSNDKLMVKTWVSPVDEHSVSRSLLGHQYNFTIWAVATPLTQDNRLLAKLSREVFALEPRAYAVWVLKSLRFAISETMLSRTFLVAFALFVGAAAATLWRRRELAVSGEEARTVTIMAAVGTSFFLAKTLLVVLVEPAYTRYVFPATVFLPPLLVVTAFALSRKPTLAGP